MAAFLAVLGLLAATASASPASDATAASPLAVAGSTSEPAAHPIAASMYANLITTRMGGLTPEEIALLMSMLDDNGDGELTCASQSCESLAQRRFTPTCLLIAGAALRTARHAPRLAPSSCLNLLRLWGCCSA
jgi:hypothetical protein